MAQYELVKATSPKALYIGLVMIIIGGFLSFKPTQTNGVRFLGFFLIFIGLISSAMYIGNRKDQMCPIDPNDNSPCYSALTK